MKQLKMIAFPCIFLFFVNSCSRENTLEESTNTPHKNGDDGSIPIVDSQEKPDMNIQNMSINEIQQDLSAFLLNNCSDKSGILLMSVDDIKLGKGSLKNSIFLSELDSLLVSALLYDIEYVSDYRLPERSYILYFLETELPASIHDTLLIYIGSKSYIKSGHHVFQLNEDVTKILQKYTSQ